MGGFLAFSRDLDAEARRRALLLMDRVLPTERIRLQNSGWEVWCYSKISWGRHLLASDGSGNMAIAVGTPIVSGQGSPESLNCMFMEWVRTGELQQTVSGQFACLFLAADSPSLTLITDSNSILPVYFRTDLPMLSTSFLSLLRPSDQAGLDLEAVAENVLLGYQTGAKTWAPSVRRLTPSNQRPIDRCMRLPLGDPRPEDDSKRGFSEEVEYQVQGVKSHVDALRGILASGSPLLGVSSGYDSRLLLGVLLAADIEQLELFTFHKPGAADQKLATMIGAAVNHPVRIELGTGASPDLRRMARDAFFAFDGQVNFLSQLLRPEYTHAFREKLFGKSAIQLSGVGGEIFRSFQGTPRMPIPFQRWVESVVFSGNSLDSVTDSRLRTRIKEGMMQYLRTQLSVREKGVGRQTQHAFYRDVFLRDWHGIRNGAENRFGHYLPVFLDRGVSVRSRTSVRHHGYGGRFQAAMISRVKRELADLPSGYGHSFSAYGFRQEFTNFLRSLRIWMPTKVRQLIRVSGQRSSAPHRAASGDEMWELTELALDTLCRTDLPINWEKLMSSVSRRAHCISVGLSLEFLRETVFSPHATAKGTMDGVR